MRRHRRPQAISLVRAASVRPWARLLPWLALGLLAAAAAGLPAARAAAAGPEQLVRDITAQVRQALARQAGRIAEDPAVVHRIVEAHVLPHVDFERMSRLVLGKHWRRATPDQRRRFVEGFRALLVRTYSTALADSADIEIDFLPSRPGPGPGEVEVRTEIRQPGGLGIPVSYRLHRATDGRWKAYDMSIEGVSLVGTYRSSFGAEIERAGLEALIRRLAERAGAAHNPGPVAVRR